MNLQPQRKHGQIGHGERIPEAVNAARSIRTCRDHFPTMEEKETHQMKAIHGQTYTLHPVGIIRQKDTHAELQIELPFRPGLASLSEFSHVIVLWWVHGLDNEEFRTRLQCQPPYAAGHLTGVFACRAEYRPNPIALTPCRILSVDEAQGIVRIAAIDALDGSPLLDLKAYFPVLDRVQHVQLPNWLQDWPEWQPEEGIGLE